MKRLLTLTALALLALSPATAEAAPKKLPFGEARDQALSAMLKFTIKRDNVYSPTIRSCVRKSRTRFRCTGSATGEDDRYMYRCDLTAAVVNRYRRLNYSGYWEAKASLTRKDCKRAPKPYLEDQAAGDAVSVDAEKLAGRPVLITDILRFSNTELVVYAEWQQVGEFGGETCSMRYEVTLNAARRILLAHDSPSCF